MQSYIDMINLIFFLVIYLIRFPQVQMIHIDSGQKHWKVKLILDRMHRYYTLIVAEVTGRICENFQTEVFGSLSITTFFLDKFHQFLIYLFKLNFPFKNLLETKMLCYS